MRFKRLDLNLLVALDILLEEQNVSRTAERMNISQSAMSGALSRLRQHFSDELLTPFGRRFVLTPLAETLRPTLRSLILQLDSIVGTDGNFDPATSERHFRVEIPDHLVPVIFPELLSRITKFAPKMLVEVCRPRGDPTLFLHRGELDIAITPDIYANASYCIDHLAEDRHVVMGWKGNPLLSEQPSHESILKMRQVIVRFDRQRLSGTLSPDQLAIYGGDGHVALISPNFSSIPSAIVGTEMIAVIHRRLALVSSKYYPIVIWEIPIEMPETANVMMYHPARKEDQGLAWLRMLLKQLVDDVDRSNAG